MNQDIKDIMSKKKYTMDDFLKIMEILRSPEGCPWDREQDHNTLKSCMMEEAAELLASIRIFDQSGNYENLREELGDILLQVVMHSQISKENGLFTFDEVVDEIAKKMIRRHPHVFGQESAKDSREVLVNWDEIKKKEKEGKVWIESPLKEIPKELPSLNRAQKVVKKAGKIYGRKRESQVLYSDLKQRLDKLIELSETKKSDDNNTTEVMGRFLLDLAELSNNLDIHSEQVLRDITEEFIEDTERL